MAEQVLAARSAISSGLNTTSRLVSIESRDHLTLANLSAAKGKRDALLSAVKQAYNIELPAPGTRVEGKNLALVWSGPGQWLAVAERGAGRDLELELKPILAGLASVTDQSDARAVIRVSGPRARNVLAKGVPVDLHPRAFGPGAVAITHASHIGAILWQLDAAPTYELAMFRSYAQSFADWLEHSAAEYRIA